jgi:penicillin-binding protein 2
MSLPLPTLAELRDIHKEIERFHSRVVIVQWVILLCFALLAARLIYLQVIRHDDLMAQAESNRTAILPTVPPRGNVIH